MTAVLHRLGYTYKKAKPTPGKPDPELQEGFLETYKKIKENKEKDDPIYFMDATHPQHNPIIGCAWIKRGEDYPIKSNTGHQRLNINGAIEIQTYTVQIRFDVTIDAAPTIALFQQIEKANPYAKRLSFQSARCLFACLTLSRLELLDTLRRSGPRSIDELARHAERDPVTAGADVARLGELGLIDQAPRRIRLSPLRCRRDPGTACSGCLARSQTDVFAERGGRPLRTPPESAGTPVRVRPEMPRVSRTSPRARAE